MLPKVSLVFSEKKTSPSPTAVPSSTLQLPFLDNFGLDTTKMFGVYAQHRAGLHIFNNAACYLHSKQRAKYDGKLHPNNTRIYISQNLKILRSNFSQAFLIISAYCTMSRRQTKHRYAKQNKNESGRLTPPPTHPPPPPRVFTVLLPTPLVFSFNSSLLSISNHFAASSKIITVLTLCVYARFTRHSRCRQPSKAKAPLSL